MDIPSHLEKFRKIETFATKELDAVRVAAHKLRSGKAERGELETLKVVELAWQGLMVNANNAAVAIGGLK